MKVWIITNYETRVTDEGIKRMPKIWWDGYRCTHTDIGADRCLCRVAGTPAQIDTMLVSADITQLTDEEARKIIKSKYPNSDLENLDVADPEIDEIAKAHGIDPKIRADILIPSRIGKPLLQEQEHYLLKVISEKVGLTRPDWDTIFKAKYNKLGIEIEEGMLKGRGEDHERILSEIRAKVFK